jgi:hypothetical protein
MRECAPIPCRSRHGHDPACVGRPATQDDSTSRQRLQGQDVRRGRMGQIATITWAPWVRGTAAGGQHPTQLGQPDQVVRRDPPGGQQGGLSTASAWTRSSRTPASRCTETKASGDVHLHHDQASSCAVPQHVTITLTASSATVAGRHQRPASPRESPDAHVAHQQTHSSEDSLPEDDLTSDTNCKGDVVEMDNQERFYSSGLSTRVHLHGRRRVAAFSVNISLNELGSRVTSFRTPRGRRREDDISGHPAQNRRG